MTDTDDLIIPIPARLTFPIRDREAETNRLRRAVETTLDILAEDGSPVGTVVTMVDHDLTGGQHEVHVTAMADVHGCTALFAGHGAADRAKAFALGVHAALTGRAMAVD